MELLLDFRRPGTADRASVALEQAQALLACNQFVLGHELPNRLVVIQAFSRLLMEQYGPALDDEGRTMLERVATSAQRVDELARRLADIGRLCRELDAEAPPETAGPRLRTALAEVAREAVAEVNLMFTGQPVEYHLEEELPVLFVARRALHQVLVQLLRNAAQASVPARPLRVEVGAASGAAGPEFWVRDNGRGLPEDQAQRLFGAFSSHGPVGGLPASTTGGQGLGLFLVRQVVARWGGGLRVRSEPEQGTTVTVLLPSSFLPPSASQG
jgi:signal transduction histidine kinase